MTAIKKIIFAGTPEFAGVALKKIIDSQQFEIVCVLTQPDRPAGRGMKLTPSAVKKIALEHHLNVQQPEKLKNNIEMQDYLKNLNADIMVVVAYGLILPQDVLDIPKWGCLNIHGSILPRWRGAAPIHRAILANDVETGVTIMQMNAGLDTGDMLISETIQINQQDTTQILHDKLADLGGNLIVDVLNRYHNLIPLKQPEEGVCYAHKISKDESKIDWNNSTDFIDRQIRALGGFCHFGEHILKIWSTEPILDLLTLSSDLKNGQIFIDHKNIYIKCSDGFLKINLLQISGGKKLSAEQFLQGKSIHLEILS